MRYKRVGKSALLQNMRWELCWLFANVLMSVGKKAAGKKNKFWVGKLKIFSILNCEILSYNSLENCADSIAYNGKRLCEGGAKKFKTFYKFFPEQKPFSFFQNYKKIKNEMVFCD